MEVYVEVAPYISAQVLAYLCAGWVSNPVVHGHVYGSMAGCLKVVGATG